MFPLKRAVFRAGAAGLALLAALLVGPTGEVLAQGKAALPSATFPYVRAALPFPAATPAEARVLHLGLGPAARALTLKQLQSLPAVEYRTQHRQLRQTFTYRGVALRDLARLGGFAGRPLWVLADNGFVATIQPRDYLHQPIMLAYLADGRPISRLHKGPLTVVLPPHPAYAAPAYGEAWVWYVERIAPVPRSAPGNAAR